MSLLCSLALVARIRFLSSQHRVSEQSGEICIPVENTAAPASQDFSISFSFGQCTKLTNDHPYQESNSLSTDSVLIGIQDGVHASGSRQGAIRFSAESSTSNLCFPHIEDDIACEADIVGQVRLINSSAVIVTEPSTATVIIEDDDGKHLCMAQYNKVIILCTCVAYDRINFIINLQLAA